MPTSRMNSTRTTVVRRISRLNRRRPRSNSVSGARLPSRTAMSPNIVFGPVAIATAVPVPLTTDVPRNTRCGASGPVPPSVGRRRTRLVGRQRLARQHRLLNRRSRDSSSRASAGTRSPADSRKTSPGTTCRNGISCHAPSRSTVAVGVTDARSRSAACCDRYDCQKLIETPSSTIVTMISASTRCPSDGDRAGDEQDDDERIGEQMEELKRRPRSAGREPARSGRTRPAAAPPRRSLSPCSMRGHQPFAGTGYTHFMSR